MELDAAADALKQLGHPTRLLIYKSVVTAGCQGIAVGQLQQQLDIPGSTLSHHISSLTSAKLISQRREGRVLYCVTDYQRLAGVIDFLQHECCIKQKG